MSRNSFWGKPERVTLLVRLVAEGYTKAQIAQKMNVSRGKVAGKLRDLNLVAYEPEPEEKPEPPPPILYPLMGVRFENVTKDEARAISANCPPSGKYHKIIRQSIYGSAAAMCVQP